MPPPVAHISRIMTVMEAAFDPTYGEAWNKNQITDALALPNTRAMVIDASGNAIASDSLVGSKAPAGFVITRKAADEEELLLIAVVPEYRRCGLGEKLIHELFKQARAGGTAHIFLEMRQGNPAIHLYEKVGFKPIGRRPNYYRLTNGERVDAITFGCAI